MKLNYLSFLLAILFVIGCEDATGPAISGGVIDVEDTTWEIEVSCMDTLYNEDCFEFCIKTNRNQIMVNKLETNPELDLGFTIGYTEITAGKRDFKTDDPFSVVEDINAFFTIVVLDIVTNESREFTIPFVMNKENRIKPSSIVVDKNNFSLSYNEVKEVKYSVFPIVANSEVKIEKVDEYTSEKAVSWEEINDDNLMEHEGLIKITGGLEGGKVTLKISSKTDESVYTYVSFYVKHRVALELNIVSKDIDFLWYDMPIKATSRLVTWTKNLEDNTAEFKDFNFPSEYRANIYVTIHGNQVGTSSCWFKGGWPVWPDNISWWEQYSMEWGAWGWLTRYGWEWARYRFSSPYSRQTTYLKEKNLVQSIIATTPSEIELPDLLRHLRHNNSSRKVSHDGKASNNWDTNTWNHGNIWTDYTVTVEDIYGYDKDRIDIEYVIHKYRRRKSDGTLWSGKYYWHESDLGKESWFVKLN